MQAFQKKQLKKYKYLFIALGVADILAFVIAIIVAGMETALPVLGAVSLIAVTTAVFIWGRSYKLAICYLAWPIISAIWGIYTVKEFFEGMLGLSILVLMPAVPFMWRNHMRAKEEEKIRLMASKEKQETNNKTINVNGVQAKFKENVNGVNIYEAKNVSNEEAEKLFAQTHFDVGLACFLGNGVKKDIGEAIKYFTLAADKGHAAAQANLGVIYYFGNEVPVDYEKGAMYLKMAADGGVPQAALNFADALIQGNGVAKDVDLAVKYLTEASKTGYTGTMLQLARMYANKENLEQDLEKAEHWAKKAIEHGAGDVGRQTLAAIVHMKNEARTENTAAPKQEAQSANPNAWMVKAFANLIKMRKIELAFGDRYMMDFQPMDGFTLYDAFVSVRMNLDRKTAELDVPNNSVLSLLTGDIRRRIITVDMHDMGDYGRYEHMYEIKRNEFYILLLKYLDE